MRYYVYFNCYFPLGDMPGKQKEEATSWKPDKDSEDGSVTSTPHQDFSDDAVMV